MEKCVGCNVEFPNCLGALNEEKLCMTCDYKNRVTQTTSLSDFIKNMPDGAKLTKRVATELGSKDKSKDKSTRLHALVFDDGKIFVTHEEDLSDAKLQPNEK